MAVQLGLGTPRCVTPEALNRISTTLSVHSDPRTVKVGGPIDTQFLGDLIIKL